MPAIAGFIAWMTSWLGLIGGIYKLFSIAQENLNPEVKISIANWLKNLDSPRKTTNWPRQFGNIFDSVFGERHLSWRCFYRSCLASLISVLIMFCMAFLLDSRLAEDFLRAIRQGRILSTLTVIMMLAALLNCIPDYFSLLETRLMISMAALKYSLSITTLILLVDLVFTTAIFFLGFLIFSVLLIPDIYLVNPLENILKSLLSLTASLSLRGTVYAAGIFFYSTFFTSVWLWIYFLTAIVVKLLNYGTSGINRLLRFLDIENQPLKAVAMVANLAVTLIYFIASILYWILR